MSDALDRTERYRVRTYIWDASTDEGPVCQLAESGYVEAADAREAVAAAGLEQAPKDVDRFVVDVQHTRFSLHDKAAEWVPWRIVVVWLAGQGQSIEHIREHLERVVPISSVAADDAGNVGLAAGIPSHLDWEAMEDFEEVLGDALGDDLFERMSSALETSVRTERPSLDELRAELLRSATHAMTEAFPPPPPNEVDETEPDGPDQRELVCELLLKLAGGDTSAPEVLAVELGQPVHQTEEALAAIERWGLALPAGEDGPPLLLRPGEQFLTRKGRVPTETLNFLAGPIDDLDAREAVRRAGFVLLNEFGEALEAKRPVEHARTLVPPAFEEAVDLRLASRLHAAASALMVRLTRGEPAGCVAEEILAVRLIELARAVLDLHEEELGEEVVAHASGEMSGVFELFQDDDVLNLFEMTDPADAALAGHDPVNRQMGVADQRVEAWFQPFSWTVPTGHLDEAHHYCWP